MSLPIVTIKTATDSHEARYGMGGTTKDPYAIGGGFFTIDIPGELGILISTNGMGRTFESIQTDKHVIYTRGSISNGSGTNYIPDNPAAYRRFGRNEVMGFEVIPVLFFNQKYMAPDESHRDLVQSLVNSVSGVKRITKYPRLKRLQETFSDKRQPLQTPFGETDMGWLLEYWSNTMGGQDKLGWYDRVCTRGSGGFDNWHYDGLVWLGLNYLENPSQSNYEFGYQQAMAHACYGRSWSGSAKGMARYEKGNEFIGEAFSDKAWEKQWSGGLILWWLITGNPVFKMQIDMMREYLKKSNPDNVWKGYWGARIGSHYLDELREHYLVKKEDWILDKARQFMANCKKWQAPDKCWDNKGSSKTESPWMQAQLITSMFKWLEQAPELSDTWSIADIVESGAAIWTLGSHRLYNKPMFYYRFRGNIVLAPSMHITAFAVPMLHHMSAHDPAWKETYKEVRDFVVDYAGTDLNGVVTDQPTPITELGYRFPREGPGWSKALRFYLVAMK